jgi:hypothetical protein
MRQAMTFADLSNRLTGSIPCSGMPFRPAHKLESSQRVSCSQASWPAASMHKRGVRCFSDKR